MRLNLVIGKLCCFIHMMFLCQKREREREREEANGGHNIIMTWSDILRISTHPSVVHFALLHIWPLSLLMYTVHVTLN